MNIINPSFSVMSILSKDASREMLLIEKAARTCYKSEDKIKDNSAEALIRNLIKNGHEAMLEHSSFSVKFIVDRGVSHEIVRHRLFSFAQESTRYCNYNKDKFGNEITVIKPCFYEEGTEEYQEWYNACLDAEKHYFKLLELGSTPQEARSVLPNSLKTEIVVTGNYREWRHFFKLRTDKAAHPQIREVSTELLKWVKKYIPIIFDDIEIEGEDNGS